jgi:hypothetical protein
MDISSFLLLDFNALNSSKAIHYDFSFCQVLASLVYFADSASPCPITVPILYTYLTERLPSFVTVSDASLETIALLRVLHAINRHWDSLYDVSGLKQTHPLHFFVVLSLVGFSVSWFCDMASTALPLPCILCHLQTVQA